MMDIKNILALSLMVSGHCFGMGFVRSVQRYFTAKRLCSTLRSNDVTVEHIASLISAQPELVNQPFANDQTLVEWAIRNDRFDIFVVALDHGADIHKRYAFCKTLVHLAVECSCSSFLQELIRRGANTQAADVDGDTPLHSAAKNKRIENTQQLISVGVNVDVANHTGATPLHYATGINCTEIMRQLIDAGANVNAADSDEKRPLHYASFALEAMQLLLQRGAHAHVKDDQGYTPLHIAAVRGNVPMLQALLEHNAKINFRADDGCTALELAIDNEHGEATRVLLEHGARTEMEGYNALACIIEKLMRRHCSDQVLLMARMLLEKKANLADCTNLPDKRTVRKERPDLYMLLQEFNIALPKGRYS